VSQSSSARPETAAEPKKSFEWFAGASWGFAIIMVALVTYMALLRFGVIESPTQRAQAETADEPEVTVQVALPVFTPENAISAVKRTVSLRTIVNEGSRDEPVYYTVEEGDSVFGIATAYGLQPETVLWSNYETLNDDPHTIAVGQTLTIPPADGVLYKWQAGDTLEKVAQNFKVDSENILLYPGNHLDLVEPVIEPGTLIMIPGGQREFRTWVVPTIPRGAAGVNTSIYGPGACDTSAGGLYGTGTFVWPSNQHVLSGNDYWSGHLAIDIAALTGDPVYAADSGVVVYAGAISGGYGNMVMIDHGNGYQTLYAHLSAILVRCGSSVVQGQTIGQAGSTGNSTGPHLHFEVRYFGGFVNPWYVLP
jgi:murein DD-endopeptidase MepM/ murein hydrolase activator NlpD